jgi:uncharacterized membrane protein
MSSIMQPNSTSDITHKSEHLRKGFAVVLMPLGIVIALGLVWLIYGVLIEGAHTQVFERFIPPETSRRITLPQGSVEIPVAAFNYASAFLGFLLLSIVASIANNFIRIGGHLLQPELRKIQAAIYDALRRR